MKGEDDNESHGSHFGANDDAGRTRSRLLGNAKKCAMGFPAVGGNNSTDTLSVSVMWLLLPFCGSIVWDMVTFGFGSAG